MPRTRLLAILWLVFSLLISVLSVSAQDEIAFQQGDRVIVLPDVLPVRTGADVGKPIVTELWGGMVTRVVAVTLDQAGATWLYLEDNAYGWVPANLDNQPTLTLYSADTLDQMLAETNEALSSDPNSVNAYLRRGTIALSQERYNDAESDYIQAMVAAPGELRLAEYVGKAFYDWGSFNQAQPYFQHMVDSGTVLPGTINRLALTYDNLGDLANAEYYYQMALQSVPWGLVYNNLAIFYSHQDRPDLTLNYYTSALEVDPFFRDAYRNRGLIYRNLGEYERALNDFNQAIEIDPFFADAYYSRGNLLNEIYDDAESALADYSRALEINPTDDRFYEGRGQVYFRQGDYESAIEAYKLALDFNPENVNAARNLAYIYGQAGRYTEALDVYNNVIDHDLYEHFSFLLYRAMIYLALDQSNLAIQDVNQYLTDSQLRDDFRSTAYLVRGAADLYMRQYDVALADYQMGFMAYPEFATDYGTYGQGYWVAPGRLQDAEAARLQLSNTAADADIYEQMGAIYMEFGQWEAALDAYRQALALRPNADLEAFVNQFEIFIR